MLICLFLAAGGPVFDVSSVKPSPPSAGNIRINLGTAEHGEVTLRNTTLSECIQFAYGLSSEDQIVGPAWMRDRSLRVDIIAKAPPGTPRDQLLLMLQNLLVERFRLETHREARPLAHYELELGKGAPKIVESKDDFSSSNLRAYGRGRLSYAHLTMQALAILLSRQLKEVVIDETGLKGFYDINLEWAPEDAAPDGPPLPDVFTAVREQLGLRLEAKKTPVDAIVVDRADKVPIAN